MASIRRTLSPVPRPGSRSNGEACSVASPLSKSSSVVQNPLQPNGLSYSYFNSLEYALYKVHNYILGWFSHRSSRPLDRSKPKGHVWKRALLHFLVCFLVGLSIGLTPFGSMNFPARISPHHQTLFFDIIPSSVKYPPFSARNISMADENKLNVENATLQEQVESISSETLAIKLVIEDPPLEVNKLLIVITPTNSRPFQAYYLNRLGQTLKLVPPPLVWIVVEMDSQSIETAEILRKTGLMYRHLVCNKNITDIKYRNVYQRNAALAHIETHRLNGIVYFADDANVYSVDLFTQLRQIRRFGTWKVAALSMRGAIFRDGPVFNGSEIIGWSTRELTRRFHADMSGFAFNSTILWDPKRWHRHILEPIRQIDTLKERFLASAFIEQIVEDESQMEGLLGNCSSIMVWRFPLESSSSSYPRQWFISRNVEKQLSTEVV
ncbi:probable beta-1,4-xylosyltransferase IRX9H [Amaranthus tricolor]|uniref:probable beta-1,4-xylosyltransferase IRX9H n=1 Tax=Amaranthus tricolor TaxID=29722 RepID=UPI00258F9F0F|nr:probable beta-1,4-xylosyltransferase IRX9H [Amaranthus tricolor]XP_057525076.1 probable beta-1,4-xylosyltransferase IRX9H [Amaranthus tricolor]